jgi:signal transduction histidine kinase
MVGPRSYPGVEDGLPSRCCQGSLLASARRHPTIAAWWCPLRSESLAKAAARARTAGYGLRLAGLRGAWPWRQRVVTVLGVGTAVVVWAAVAVGVGWRDRWSPLWVFVATELLGLLFVSAGLRAWWRQPDNRSGLLMVACGAGWYFHDLQASGNPVVHAIGNWLYFLPAFLLVHLALAFPHGRLAGRLERCVVAGGYLAYLVLEGVRYLREGPAARAGWQMAGVRSPLGDVLSVVGIVVGVVSAVLLIRRWVSASRPARRAYGLVWLAMLIVIAAAITAAVGALRRVTANVQLGLQLLFGAGLLVVLGAYAVGRVRAMLARMRVTDLVRNLQHAVDAQRLRDLLADALDDPTLRVGFWSEEADGYVGVDGKALALPVGDPARTVTSVEREDGRRLAVLAHDSATVEDRPMVEAVMGAARLALENARLHAEERALLARLVDGAMRERRRIERDLHDGLQHRLLLLGFLARQTRDATSSDADRARLLEQLQAEANRAYHDLRALTQGIHPAILTEQGLAIAIEERAPHATTPVVVDLPPTRYPPTVEATAYFVISEGLTNADKHAGATQVVVSGR